MQNELTLQQIHDVELEALIFFDRLCKEQNLQYALTWGTLLGSIRHKGFIPWDDDVDVWMPRADYNRFIEYCYNNESTIYPYKLCGRDNTKNYKYSIYRVSDQRYKYVSNIVESDNPDIGVFIDVYPVDKFSNNIIERKYVETKITLINIFYSIYIDGQSYSGYGIKSTIKRTVHAILNRVYGKDYDQRVNHRIYETIKRHQRDTSSYIGAPGWENKYLFFSRDVIDSGITMGEFEGYFFCIPKEWHNVLETTYGDYMVLPPEKDRVPNHGYKIIARSKMNGE